MHSRRPGTDLCCYSAPSRGLSAGREAFSRLQERRNSVGLPLSEAVLALNHRMVLTSDAYNQFTTSLVERIVERALGQDPASQRLLNVRPADYVLAGFLTPINPPEDVVLEASEENDLPQDSPYEQSSLGLEWLVPKNAFQSTPGYMLYVRVDLSVYLRRLPTYEEQKSQLSWSKALGNQEPTSQILPLWTREDLSPLSLEINLADLLPTGRLERSLAPSFAQALAARLASATDLYPGGRPLTIAQPAFTPEGYARWAANVQARQSRRARYDWEPCLDVRMVAFPANPACVRLSLRLINRTPWRTPMQAEFFDAHLYAVRLHVRIPKAAHAMMEFADLPRSYRYDRTIAAVGINADVAARLRDNAYFFATRTIPWKRVDRLEPRETEQTAPFFQTLQKAPIPLLRRIFEAMQEYDQRTWQEKIDSLSDSQREEATNDRRIFQQDEIAAFARGLALLENPAYPLVRQAFILMNEVMERVGANRYDRWRLFQIVFIVIQIPRLAVRHYPELAESEEIRKEDEKVDILWFAAGGGKTEAFLGLLVWQLFFDRLRGKEVGVTALVRFPLRLLTFQQLQRLARVLAQAEIIRSRERLGGGRFSLGYFVGDNTRPNKIDDDRDARYSANGPDEALRSLMRCPFCQGSVVLRYNKPLRLIEHCCAEQARCPGGKRSLPIYIVDSDIYRYLPSVIVSTIDKLALIGQNPRFGNLFGRFNLYCARHGASFGDVSANDKCKAAQVWAQIQAGKPVQKLTTCEGARVLYGPFVDPVPALHIQDELHLLSEETGVFDSHYETAALAIMLSLGQRPWKIIAATATIERFENHARNLYLRGARQFPCPGPGAYESFYYRVNPEKIGRIFVGVLGVGRKHTPSVTRLLSLIYQELQAARDEAKRDLQKACERYRLPELTREDYDFLVFYYELVLTYVLTRKGSDQITEAIQSRVVKELRDLMPNYGELLLETLNGGVDVIEMIKTMELIELAQKEGDPTERIRGVVATNIISHGVDIDRFNMIVFGGFTRLVAEYIQASARVGRTFPGISFLVVTPQSDRDRSIFQRFDKFHEYIDRLIDPSAINRWPMQALERTVPGVLAGYLMIVAAGQLNKQLDTIRKVQQALGGENADCLKPTAVLAWMRMAFGVDQAPYERYARVLERIVENRYALIIDAAPEQLQGWDGIRTVLEPMRSLRDVDDPAFIAVRDADAALLRSLLRS